MLFLFNFKNNISFINRNTNLNYIDNLIFDLLFIQNLINIYIIIYNIYTKIDKQIVENK